MRNLSNKISRRARLLAAGPALGLAVAVCVPFTSQAQRTKESGVNVTGISTRTKGGDAVVSIAADGPLTRAQTWQDGEGFHVIVYQGTFKGGAPRDVKVRRVGNSLEVVVPVRSGGGVYVQPRFNSLDLVIDGGLHVAPDTAHANSPLQTSRAAAVRQSRETTERASLTAPKPRANTGDQSSPVSRNRESSVAVKNDRTKPGLQPLLTPPAALKFSMPQSAAQSPVTNQPSYGIAVSPAGADVPAGESAANQPQAMPPVTAPPVSMQIEVSRLSDETPMRRMLIVLSVCGSTGLAAFMFIFLRARRKTATTEKEEGERHKTKQTMETVVEFESEVQLFEQRKGERRAESRHAADPQSLVQSTATAQTQSLQKSERRLSPPVHTNVPAVIFGAYQIDREVENLIAGQRHSIEVLASRGSDDRRAIEASLLKALHSSSLGQTGRDRARFALEEYGFVARHSAAVLLAPDAYERSSAAHALGQMRSRASLPFLLEALYDGEQIVCAEAVKSLGALGLPSAIGALLDMARRHPELPSALLGRALSACSVDCLEMSANVDESSFDFAAPAIDAFTGEIRGLEPTVAFEQLPEWMEDDSLADALERLDSADVEARVAAAQQLAQFQVQRSVEALTSLAAGDRDAAVRAAAVTSLGNIGHESVFPSVLISMADEGREVRAAAARALSRLSFDRADAYVRVLETADAETLHRLASACVNAGLAGQALSRLASEDRRQAYEAFSLLSLVAKGGQSDIIFKVVEEHEELNLRLAASRLLGLMGNAELDARLRRIALGANAPETLRTAILEAVYQGDPNRVAGQMIEAN